MPVQSMLLAHDLCISAASGRPLFRDLTLALDRGDRVALVGRNGAGKSTLLVVLTAQTAPRSGKVSVRGSHEFVPQQMPLGVPSSAGQWRRAALARAFTTQPDVLLLDEPTRDLDGDAVRWLLDALERFDGAVLVVSHDRRLLERFDQFFVVAESGSKHFSGSFDAVLTHLRDERTNEERRYVRRLADLVDKEQRNDRLQRRRARKKNLGRLHELKRCPARAQLNGKRGYAQVSQGKRAELQHKRIESARQWVKAARRSLAVDLPLNLTQPVLGAPTTPVINAQAIAGHCNGRTLFAELSFTLDRQRLAIVGPNGSGKTTLVETLTGRRPPLHGKVRCDDARIGYIAQNASNWQHSRSLIELLCSQPTEDELERCAHRLRSHRFPLALAERPLVTLSPGERVRAALICLFERDPVPELLVLDEPSDALDLLGLEAMERALTAWPGGLLVVSHDRDWLRRIGVDVAMSFD